MTDWRSEPLVVQLGPDPDVHLTTAWRDPTPGWDDKPWPSLALEGTAQAVRDFGQQIVDAVDRAVAAADQTTSSGERPAAARPGRLPLPPITAELDETYWRAQLDAWWAWLRRRATPHPTRVHIPIDPGVIVHIDHGETGTMLTVDATTDDLARFGHATTTLIGTTLQEPPR
jgi:hypothetical protein